jgi:CheY-like chemotaxis protein
MDRVPGQRARVTAAAAIAALAVLRIAFHGRLGDAIDSTFLLMLAIALVLVFVPLDKLQSLKAGGFELALTRAEVQGALAALGLDRIDDTILRDRLSSLSRELRAIVGSRVLWIDDRPHNLLAERRLFRALGVHVVPAVSSERAAAILEEDNDFDLILTDVQRKDDVYRATGGPPIHGGVNFIRVLRTHEDPAVRSLPVIFYAAYEWERLVDFTRPARELQPEAGMANRLIDLLPEVVRVLAEARSRPLAVAQKKEATAPRYAEDEPPG